MSVSGLTLPFVSTADPDTNAEGGLDPLGLAGLADRLANEIAPEVTARMRRLRFVTAMAACASLLVEPADTLGPDGTPAYLAFEWLIVEALVRKRPASGVTGVPGSDLAARRVRDHRRHLNATSYLNTPKVFGFHGVYKRIARDLRVVDDRFRLDQNGHELLRAWEQDTGLSGFVDRRAKTDGGRLADEIFRQVRSATERGEVQLGHTSRWWPEISAAFGPGEAGPSERRLLTSYLDDEQHPIRTELVRLVATAAGTEEDERAMVTRFAETSGISAGLSMRLDAILAYEALVRRIADVFTLTRLSSTQAPGTRLKPETVAGHEHVATVAKALPALYLRAVEAMAVLGLDAELENQLGSFRDEYKPAQLVEAVLDRHDTVQSRKGKRSWFERDGQGFVVRGIGSADGAFEPSEELIHPYRLYALRRFCQDLSTGRHQ
ncbi:MAG: hypothetical protein ACR2MB_15815 [Acidimicrobiales bacterium]